MDPMEEDSFRECRLYIEDEWHRKQYIKYVPENEKVKLSVGFVPKLVHPETQQDPFTIMVKGIKKKNRFYHAILFDGRQKYSAILASQMNKLIEWGLLCSGRVISVENYAVSNIDLDDKIKKVIIITGIKILLIQGSVNLLQ